MFLIDILRLQYVTYDGIVWLLRDPEAYTTPIALVEPQKPKPGVQLFPKPSPLTTCQVFHRLWYNLT